MRKTREITYAITDCVGREITTISLNIPRNDYPGDHDAKAIRRAGYDPAHRCEGCGDSAYRARVKHAVR